MTSIDRRRFLQSAAGGFGFLLLRPSLALATEQSGVDDFVAFAVASGPDVGLLSLLGYDPITGFQVRELATQGTDAVVATGRNVVDVLPHDFWPTSIGLSDAMASATLGSFTQLVQLPEEDPASRPVELDDEPTEFLPANVGPPTAETEQPATFGAGGLELLKGYGVLASQVRQAGRLVSVELQPEFEDGDHLAVAKIMIDDNTSLIKPESAPVGAASSFFRPSRAVVVAIDCEAGIEVFQENKGEQPLTKTAFLERGLPGSTLMMNGGHLAAWADTDDGPTPFVLRGSNWKPASRGQSKQIEGDILAVGGQDYWLTDNTDKSQLNVLSVDQ